MAEIEGLLEAAYFGNTAAQWGVAATLAIVVFSALLLLRRVVRSHHTRLAATPQMELIELPLEVASRTTLAFMLVSAAFAGLRTLEFPPAVEALALSVFTIAVFWQAGLWATTAVFAWIERKRGRTLSTDRAAASTLGVIGFLARATIWSLVLLLTLANLGIQIGPLLAGLGIGGIAVALAAQNILSDLFASLSITLDRPFVVGDSLGVDEFSGTVEYIGVKSTRLRSLSGEQIIMPNSNLLNSRVRNFARMSERRVVLNVSVSQETTRAQLQAIPGMLRSLIESQPDTRFDRAHFAKIAATSFDFEAVWFVTTADYNRHMDILQGVHLRLIEAFERESISLAFPSQRLVLKKTGDAADV